jgi:membrane protease YdiL (CAAX protease family)
MNWTWPTIWTGERGGWWRLLVTAALYVSGVVLGMLLFTAVMLGGLKAAIQNQPAYVQDVVPLVGTSFITGLGLAGCLIGIRFVHRQPVARVFTDGRSFGWRLAVQSAVVWSILWFANTLVLAGGWAWLTRRTGEIPLWWWPVLIGLMLCAMTVGRTAEEVVFRGYLQTRVAAWVKRPWLAIALSTFLFTIVHRGANSAALTAIALFGIVFGAASVRAGTLAPMIGAHVAHDALEGLFQPSGHPNTVNASTTWREVVLIAISLAFWLGWLFWATRKTVPRIAEPSCLPLARE